MTNPKPTDTGRSGDLVERFNRFLSEWGKSRQYGDVIYGLHVGTDREVELTATSIREAADRIAALEAENERLRGRLAHAEDDCEDDCIYCEERRQEIARATLAKLQENNHD